MLQGLGQEDPLEMGMSIHSSILTWKIPWTEEPGGLQTMRSQGVGHDWGTSTFTFITSTKFWYGPLFCPVCVCVCVCVHTWFSPTPFPECFYVPSKIRAHPTEDLSKEHWLIHPFHCCHSELHLPKCIWDSDAQFSHGHRQYDHKRWYKAFYKGTKEWNWVDCLRYTCQGVLHSGGPRGGTCVFEIEDSGCLKANFATWKGSLLPLFLADSHKLGVDRLTGLPRVQPHPRRCLAWGDQMHCLEL